MANSVRVFLSATLRSFIEGYDAFSGLEIPIGEPITITQLCQKIGIPWERVKIAMVDGKKVAANHMVKGGERVALFPAVGGG
ncbi:MAG TPA: thiamine biosynthesis protein ThiS [Desulfobacterales bacterium]|nr:thiamine biosynthesis protein ThiS [Desulfobacterales bacterium]